MKTEPDIHTLLLDKYNDRLRTVYDALDELKTIMSRKEWDELHKMYQDGSLGGSTLEEQVEMAYGDFNDLVHGVVDAVA